MRSLAAALLIGLYGCQTAPTPTPEASYHVIDLTGAYSSFFDRSADMPTEARVEAFKAEMAPLFPGFYDPARVASFWSAEQYNAQIARSFAAYPEQRAAIANAAARFRGMIEPARRAFQAVFPDAAPIGEIYLLHSVGEMDGGLRNIGGRTNLVFGADVIARVHAPGSERPFFHHELFHVYHRQFFIECEQVWCALWSEGLAVYVAEQLNPGANDTQLLLTSPRPIRPEVDANLSAGVCAVQARFDSATSQDYAALFTGRSNAENLPPRAGYYVGYLVARRLGRERTLTQLAGLTIEEARPLVGAALAELAPGCSNPN